MLEYTYQNDAACWKKLKEGHPDALGYLYDTYIDRLFQAALKMTDNRELAKDALQEIFVEIWHYRASIGDVNHSYGYLVKVLKSILLKKVKSKIIVTELLDRDQGFYKEETVEEVIISADTATEQKNKLNRAFGQLTSRQKQVVRLRFFEGLTYEQIAAKLSMNYQSVNNLAFRAMINLRRQMFAVAVILITVAGSL